jgi:hypothetical protein
MNRKTVPWLMAMAALGALAILAQRRSGMLERRLENERADWAAERAELQTLLERAEAPRLIAAAPAPVAVTALSPREIIARLQRLSPAGNPTRNLQLAVYWLEELARRGPAALAAIQDFLAAEQDLDLDLGWLERGRGWRDRLPGDFVAPPSLRFGLFDVVRRIGGPASEQLLSVMQTTTGRGLELAYLTRVLHELAPHRYRDPALAAARQLLADGRPPRYASALDRHHRDHLLTVLAFYDDPSYVAQAEAQLVGDTGVDRAALSYLHRALGRQAVTLAARAYADPRVQDPGQKEPLARVALAHVPDDPEALALWQKAINDPALPGGARSNLIEDLNEVGFPAPDHLTAGDLPLVERRLALIDRLAPAATDPVQRGALEEARKDLLNEQRRLRGGPPASQ